MDLSDYAEQDLKNLAAEQPPPAAAQAPAGPPSDPMDQLRPYLVQRAREISTAQKDAAERQRWADMANGFERGGAMVAGREADKDAIARNDARAQLPVTQLKERQGLESEATKNAAQDIGLQKEMTGAAQLRDSLNPGSDLSKRARLLAVAQGLIPASYTGDYTAAMHEDMLKGATIQQAREKTAAELAQHKAQLKFEQNKEAREAKQGDRRLDIEEGRTKFEQAQKGRIPEQEAAKIVNQTQALQALDQLEQLHKEVGITGLSPIGNSAKNRYDDAINALAGAVAAGALPAARETPALMEEFKKGFPGATTSHDRARLAFQRLRDTVKQNAGAQIAALKAGNYNPGQVAELERQVGAAKPAAAPGVEHPQDEEAIAWAKANPQDPRAAKILELNK
jgi:hypothetical protein